MTCLRWRGRSSTPPASGRLPADNIDELEEAHIEAAEAALDRLGDPEGLLRRLRDPEWRGFILLSLARRALPRIGMDPSVVDRVLDGPRGRPH